MTDYEKKTDEELIMDFRGGDTAIMDYLLEKYTFLIMSIHNQNLL